MRDEPKSRLFVALPVPDAVKASLQQAQAELRSVLPPHLASWTKPDNMHLTLRFLGDVAPAGISGLREQLAEAVAGFGTLPLTCERLGCFPDLRFPRVLWAWVHDAQERLPQLVQRVNEATSAFAERVPDARFVGHITLARPRPMRRPEAAVLAKFVEAAVAREFGSWPAEELELIRSELSPGGSHYTTLAKLQLA